jgi:Nuclease-related domain
MGSSILTAPGPRVELGHAGLVPERNAVDRRPGDHARERARERTWEFLRRFKWRLLMVVLVLTAIILGVAVLERDAFARGLIVGAGLVATAWMIGALVLSGDASYTWRRGAEAEDDTARLLRRALPDWTLLHGISLVSGDIDHVAIGPGAVLAIESKWTGDPWERPRGRSRAFIAALNQAKQSARRTQSFLRTKGCDTTVQPVVVAWGPGAPSFGQGTKYIDSVLVIEGRKSPQLAELVRGDTSAEQVTAITTALSQLR